MLEIQWHNIDGFFRNQQRIVNPLFDTLNSINEDTPFYKVLSPQFIKNNLKTIKDYQVLALSIRENYKNLVIVGMGGATLNSKTLFDFLPAKEINIYFLESTDPIYYNNLIKNLDLNSSVFLFISNSGETLETILLFKAIYRKYKALELPSIHNHLISITGAENNTLRTISEEIGARVLDHTSTISGRYSTFTNVMLLPGILAGLDMKAFLEGALKVLEDFWQQKESAPAIISAATFIELNYPNLVNVGYLKCFKSYLEWYCQIIAESVGKEGKGFTPLNNIAPEAHHSLFQLYLGGPKDKVFSFFYVKNLPDFEMLLANNAAFEAASLAFNESKLPLRNIILKDITEETIGSLMTFSIIEVVVMGEILKINPFNQPHIDKIKHFYHKLLDK